MLTHQWEEVLEKTAKVMGHKLMGGIGKCDHCARGRAQRTKLDKEVDDGNSEPGVRVQIDMTSRKTTSLGEKMCSC